MTETTIAKLPESQVAIPSDVSAGAMAAALAGDLSRLTEADKLKFVGALCQFTGLNPLSKPFEWIVLKGKLTLYANKGCAEQLRKIHKVTIDILERKTEHGVHMVRVKATDHTGRTDESIGAVPFDDKMMGEDKANAFMKAETKAKRRVSLSICGLGMLDESELDQVKHAKQVTEVVTTESAGAIADQLNAEIGKSKVQDAVIVPEVPKAEPLKPVAPVIEINEFAQPEPVQPPATGELSPADKMARELETVLSGHSTKASVLDCIGYCQKQGKLPADTKDLAKIDADYGAKILAKPATFIGAVETWVKGGKK
jgi:hypothetical protein